MEIVSETLDDLLRALYPELLKSPQQVATSRGDTLEVIGFQAEITQPRARLSRTESRGRPFSCLGELLWYLSRNNDLDFIRYYIPKYADESDDGLTVYGGYGPRLFRQRGHNQIQNIVALLRKNSNTRRAVIQLFNAEDVASRHLEIPCTTTWQFMLRDKKLHMVTTMRSNDAYKGLPHDVFCFTMLQELVARSLEAELGSYKHFVGSMHLYSRDAKEAEQYIAEGFQSRIEMPLMPQGDPWPSVSRLLEVEERIRTGGPIRPNDFDVDPYWADLIRLLQIFAAGGDDARIEDLKSAMAFKRYGPYIDTRKGREPRPPHQPTQPKFLL